MTSPDAPLPFEEEDVFRGFEAEDVTRLSALLADPEPRPDVFTTSFGVRVDPLCYPIVAHLAGQAARGVPLPSDGFIGDGIEYAALALALERTPRGGPFRICEAGAGWGPWSSLGALLALRHGFDRATIVALEASASRFRLLRRHLALNGLVPEAAPAIGAAGAVSWRLFEAAVAVTDGALYWSEHDDEADAGMRATTDPSARQDYRGVAITPRTVAAVALATAIEGVDVVDFLHVDIQGGESELIPGTLDLLDRRVRSLFVGTHSRKIEGDLIDTLHGRGWLLAREKPCRFYGVGRAPTLDGLTYRDGGQFWINPAFG